MERLTRRAFAGVLGGAALAAGRRPPNILYIMSDDHAANAISAYGSRVNRTPNIDRIARGGMRMENCFCTNSICTPSRAVILTGQYSHINGVKTLRDPLDAGRPHLGTMMQQAGYQTAIAGKWHLHCEPTGFDYWNVLTRPGGQGLYHNPVMSEMGSEKTYPGYATDIITDLSLEFLRRRDRKRPFFLMCHHKAPHRAWQPDAKHAGMYTDPIPEPLNLYDRYEHRSQAAARATLKIGDDMTETDFKQPRPPGLTGDALRKWAYQRYMQDYLRCVASVDDNVGRLLDYLDREKLSEDTMVIYTSDQGFFLGEHGYYDKRFMYEESLRMPLLIRKPGQIPAGAVNRDLVLNLDFAPTLLDFAGRKAGPGMQGRSFRAALEGRTPRDWRRSFYYRYWMHLADHGVPAHYGVRTRRYKLIYYYGQPLGTSGSLPEPRAPEWELFDLEKDPHEMRSVYGEPAYAGVVKELKAELARLQKEVGDTPWEG